MILYTVIFLGGAVVGGFLIEIYAATLSRWTSGEVLLITQEIEKIKTTDISRYNTLINEWKGLVSNNRAKVELASADLRLIIAAIKNI